MNINRDYLIINDVKKSNITLDNGSMFFYITDKNTQNIFVNLVINISNNELIQKYANIENAEDYTLTMNIIKPNNDCKIIEGKLHDKEKGIFEFNLKKDCCDVAGPYKCELLTKCNINEQEEITTSNSITYIVKKSILNDLDDIVEAPEYPVVIQLLDKLSDIEQYEEDRRANELARQLAEEQRQTRFDTLDSDMVDRITAIDDKMVDVENRVSTKEQAVDKLITDTKADINEYKAAKDHEIDEYKTAKDTEINNAITNQDNKIEETISNQNDRIAVVENNDATQNARLDVLENRDTIHESRMTAIEAKNVEQDNRLDEIEAIDVAQNTRLDAIEVKNQQQDDRLLDIEKVNKRQDMNLKCLFAESKNNMIDVTEEGNSIYLQNSTTGYTLIDEIKGNTLVNCNKEPDKELILNGNINTSGDNAVTLTEGVDGGLVDVALEGNTLVNVSKTKDDYITPSIEDKVDKGSVISLPEVSAGYINIDSIEGNTLVNYCADGAKELTLNGDIDVEGTFVTTTEGADNGKVDVMCEGNTLVNLSRLKLLSSDGSNEGDITLSHPLVAGKVYSLIFDTISIANSQRSCFFLKYKVSNEVQYIEATENPTYSTILGKHVLTFTASSDYEQLSVWFQGIEDGGIIVYDNIMLLEGDWTNKEIPQYFEGMKSVGQDDINGHKIEIVSSNSDNTLSNKKEILLNEPLRGLPNGVKDRFVKIGGKWFIERNCGTRTYEEGDKDVYITDLVNTVYPLGTPTYEPLEIKPTLNTYNEVTHLSNNSIIPCNMQIKNTGYNAIIKPSTLYTVALDTDKTGTIGINLGGTKVTTTNNVATITTPETLTDDSLRLYGKGIKASGVRLLEGDKTNWIPSFFEGMKSSFEDKFDATDNTYKMEILSNNRNLFDVSNTSIVDNSSFHNIELGVNNGIKLTSTQDHQGWQFSQLKLTCLKPNTTYTLRCNITKSNPNSKPAIRILGMLDNSDYGILFESGSFTFKTPKVGTKHLGLLIYTSIDNVPTNQGDIVYFKDIQISEVASEYVDYKSNKIQFSSVKPLGKWDRFVFKDDRLMIERGTATKVFNGSENWVFNNTEGTTANRYFLQDTFLGGTDGQNISNTICDKLPTYQWSQTAILGISRTDYSAFVYNKHIKNVDELKSWLSKNNLHISYKLKEPTYEEIPFELQKIILESYDNGTLFIDTNIPPTKVTFNCFEEELTYLYPATSYTVQFVSDRTITIDIKLGGTSLLAQSISAGLNKIAITTPSELTDNKLLIDGVGSKISEVVVTDTDREFEYFEGMKSVGECEELVITSANSDNSLSNTQQLTHEPLRSIGGVKDRYVLIDGEWYIERKCGIRAYQEGDKGNYKTDLINTVYPLEMPAYDEIDYNPLEVYSDVTHISTNSTIPCNIIVKNHGFNCLLKPSTTYTISSNLGFNTVTTPSALTEDCLRFMDTDTSDITTMRDVLVLEGDWTTKADLIPANFSGIESAFEQEYDAEKGKYKVNVKVTNEDKTKENNITFYINEPLRGVGDVKDRVYVKDDKVVVQRNCGIRAYEDGDFGTYLTDKVNTLYQLPELTYEEVEYNDTKLFIESFKNSTLFYNSNVPVTSKLYYSYSVPIVDTVAQTANISDQQDSMIIDLATQVAVMEMMLM